MKNEGVRLQRYLAMAGVAARRKAEDLITAGRVQVNGQVVRQLGTRVAPDRDRVLVDGEAVVALDHFYILFNKPKACITAVTDDRGRTTVMDYLPNLPVPVKPVGRLDYYSEGVLLLTNDGELHDRLLAPRLHVAKTYHVKVRGRVAPRHVDMLRAGVRLDDGSTTLPAEVEALPAESKHAWLAITIHEGKSRQIHRMMEALGYVVTKLQRVAFANLTFHGLRVGDARELNQDELNQLRQLVGLDRSASARGKWTARREDTDLTRRAKGGGDVGDDDEKPAARPVLATAARPRPAAATPPAARGERPERAERPESPDRQRQRQRQRQRPEQRQRDERSPQKRKPSPGKRQREAQRATRPEQRRPEKRRRPAPGHGRARR